jgi:hypothetical protein
MRSERARFLDRRERRANDESSPFSALGENGRGFDATASEPHGVKNLSGSDNIPSLPIQYNPEDLLSDSGEIDVVGRLE